jgi:hypothetical protein
LERLSDRGCHHPFLGSAINPRSLICSGEYFLMSGVRSITQHGQQRECQRGLSA